MYELPDRPFIPGGVRRRHEKEICNYNDTDMEKECPECGANLVRFRTPYARSPNYQACMSCEEVVKEERATG